MAYQFSMRSSVRRRSQKCVSTACGSRRHRIARRRSRSTLTEVCVHCGSRRHRIARQRSRSTLTEVCVHSGSRRHRIARQRSRSTLTEVCVHSGSRRHRIARRRSRSTLTEVCVHCGSRRHAYGWFHTRDIWEASQTVSDHWGFQTERTTSKWPTVCLMYMDLGSTLQCASTLVGPYWFHVPSWET